MRLYLNDASLQAQFVVSDELVMLLKGLLALRQRVEVLRTSFYVSRTLPQKLVREGQTLAQLLGQPEHREMQALMLRWLGRAGPFFSDDRLPEQDDYFEFEELDVTDSGLGEAARRTKAMQAAATFSFSGGQKNFAESPLVVWHGIDGDRLGHYDVANYWLVDTLGMAFEEVLPAPSNWRELVETARATCPRLWIPDSVFLNGMLAREAFDTVISDKTLQLLKCLNDYMEARLPDGSEGPVARQIIRDHFVGDNADFSGESATNRRKYKSEMEFSDPATPDQNIFAHWHGKISHRFFRLHFEWPVHANADRLKVLYLGPKLTKG